MGVRLAAVLAISLVITTAAGARAGPDPPPSYPPIRLAAESAAGSVVVRTGDHLWKIAAAHLGSILGRNADATEITPYWRDVIVANRDGLRSGKPDLIYPGEVVILPPLTSEQR